MVDEFLDAVEGDLDGLEGGTPRWYEESSNHMLALRCAKYNGTLDAVFEKHALSRHHQ